MQNNNQQNQDRQQTAATSSPLGKEKETAAPAETPFLEEIVEKEPSEEVRKYLKKVQTGSIELPPDLKKMGLKSPAATAPVSQTVVTSLKLPLSDDQIALGLQAQILSSLRWLAEWCLKQLKKAHLSLKKVHGRFIRVRN